MARTMVASRQFRSLAHVRLVYQLRPPAAEQAFDRNHIYKVEGKKTRHEFAGRIRLRKENNPTLEKCSAFLRCFVLAWHGPLGAFRATGQRWCSPLAK